MSMRRKNKCRNEKRGEAGAKWFLNNMNRQRRIEEMAVASRRRNRGNS